MLWGFPVLPWWYINFWIGSGKELLSLVVSKPCLYRCLWKQNLIKWQKRWAGCGGFHMVALWLSTCWGTERVKSSCVLLLQETLVAGNKYLGSDCDFLKDKLPNSVQFSNGEAKGNYFDECSQPSKQKGKHLQSWSAPELKCLLRKESFSLQFSSPGPKILSPILGTHIFLCIWPYVI